MKTFVKISTITFVLAFACISIQSPQRADAQIHTVYNTSMPSVIRVAIRPFNNPFGPIEYVQTVGFREYCEDVLPNEWMPSWNTESLRAGAIAIKMFAWYHTLHPVTTEGWTYDVDNTTNFQEYKYKSGRPRTDRVVRETWNLVYAPPSGEIRPLNYRAGFPHSPNWQFVGADLMAQWGSEYWSRIARLTYPQVLRLYYPGHTLRGI